MPLKNSDFLLASERKGLKNCYSRIIALTRNGAYDEYGERVRANAFRMTT